MKKVIYLSLFILFGCSYRSEFDFPDVQEEDRDANISHGLEHPCYMQTIDRDFFNCGTCGFACDPQNSDSCQSGICRCGLSDSCGDDSDCRVGRCITPNYLGRNDCEFDDDCDVNSACIEGFCTFIRCVSEVCDGLDNDCDGVVDGTISSPLAEWCYSGPPSPPDLINPPCRPGIRVCTNAMWSECQGESSPREEVGLYACDGIDNNCDLCVDGTYIDGVCRNTIVEGFDVVFIFDPSGSMSPYSSALLSAIRRFAETFNRPDFRFSIVTIPGAGGVNPSLFQDFTDYTGLVPRLIDLQSLIAGSSEPSFDGVYEVGTNEIGLSFLEGHVRIIFLFTDEIGQSYRTPTIRESSMCSSLTHGEVFVVFESPSYFSNFDECATELYRLTSNVDELADLLENTIADPCL